MMSDDLLVAVGTALALKAELRRSPRGLATAHLGTVKFRGNVDSPPAPTDRRGAQPRTSAPSETRMSFGEAHVYGCHRPVRLHPP